MQPRSDGCHRSDHEHAVVQVYVACERARFPGQQSFRHINGGQQPCNREFRKCSRELLFCSPTSRPGGYHHWPHSLHCPGCRILHLDQTNRPQRFRIFQGSERCCQRWRRNRVGHSWSPCRCLSGLLNQHRCKPHAVPRGCRATWLP